MKFFKQCQELISTNFPDFPSFFLLRFWRNLFWEWEFRLMQQKHACFLLVKLIDIDLWEFIWERIRSWICYPLYRDFRFMVGQSITISLKHNLIIKGHRAISSIWIWRLHCQVWKFFTLFNEKFLHCSHVFLIFRLWLF